MKSTKHLLAVLVLLLLSSWSYTVLSPLKISGTVTDAIDGSPLPGVTVKLKGSSKGTVTSMEGKWTMEVPSDQSILVFSFIGFETHEVMVGNQNTIDVKLIPDNKTFEDVVIVGYGIQQKSQVTSAVQSVESKLVGRTSGVMVSSAFRENEYQPHNTEEYATIQESGFLEALKNPLSTFSIDVDNASYSNMRRYINGGQKPPMDAVRIEEMVNYFTYEYPQPEGEAPFSVNTELSECPWNPEHQLLHIGLQGKKIATEQLPPANLVFLIDVSGSMDGPERLQLVKNAFRLLVNELRPQDQVAIVVYAGAAGLVLPPTRGDQKEDILMAITRLQAGGSTAGGAGLQLAYNIAAQSFIKEGNNRVILATDGDFNVGVSSNAAMERLIEEKRETGVFLTVLGFGMGNYKDSKMEILADKGNGNYAYIDNILEAKKVFVNEFGGTLFTIAKDVKLQLEFNPAKVRGYRLIGYENRMLKSEDFKDDKKDAGELGSGHTVTALYEIIPAGIEDSPYLNSVDPLKYQKQSSLNPASLKTSELLTLKLRYKEPDGKKSKQLIIAVSDQPTALANTSDDFRFSAAVASFGMLLRDSRFSGNATFASVLTEAARAKGADQEGYRAEFLKMVQSMQLVAEK